MPALAVRSGGHSEEGVRGVLNLLRAEIDCTLAQLGRPTIKDIAPTLVDRQG